MSKLRQAYIKTIKSFPGSWDAMCAALGMTRDALENRIYERRGQDITVQTALQMQIFTGTTYIVEAIADESNGTFSPLPPLEACSNEEIHNKFHELYAELGELSTEFQAAVKDGEINRSERERINGVVNRMHRTMDDLRALTFRVYCHETAAETAARREQESAKKAGRNHA